uniref:Uncharacterized protein n=1 Tax=Oreochromis niloticus TaxID=8128 RepID=A0A669F1P5_ORENI
NAFISSCVFLLNQSSFSLLLPSLYQNVNSLKTAFTYYCTLQDPCPLCNEAKEQLQPFRHRVRSLL